MRMRGIPDYARDRIDAVSDLEAITRALDHRHNIAFFAIDGWLAPGADTRAIEALAEATFGVDKGSARLSVENAALSLAFDPERVAFAAIQSILDRKLAAMRLTLLPMAVID